MTFFKIILVFILIYLLFSILIRYVFPYLIKRHFRKTQEKFYGKSTESKKRKKEGAVNIDYDPNNNNKKNGDDLGEYVDYEEIKE